MKFLHLDRVVNFEVIEEGRAFDQSRKHRACDGVRLVDRLPEDSDLCGKNGFSPCRATGQVLVRDLLELLALTIKQRAQHPELVAKLVKQSAFANATLARKRIEGQSADSVSAQDCKRSVNCLFAGNLGTCLVIHCCWALHFALAWCAYGLHAGGERQFDDETAIVPLRSVKNKPGRRFTFERADATLRRIVTSAECPGHLAPFERMLPCSISDSPRRRQPA
ncbi:hypothetical protein PUN4_10045 [Paraburkholderia unamae]|nr:hypothetical protein PUN4_10045 [Paraburkholderia unamae]